MSEQLEAQESVSQEVATYRARLRFRVQKKLNITDAKRTLAVAGREAVLSALEDTKPIKESEWLVLNTRGFSAEAEAREFGHKLRGALEPSSTSSSRTWNYQEKIRWLRVSAEEGVEDRFLAGAGGPQARIPVKDGWYEHGMNCAEHLGGPRGRKVASEYEPIDIGLVVLCDPESVPAADELEFEGSAAVAGGQRKSAVHSGGGL